MALTDGDRDRHGFRPLVRPIRAAFCRPARRHP